jgi:hypothetical protein
MGSRELKGVEGMLERSDSLWHDGFKRRPQAGTEDLGFAPSQL